MESKIDPIINSRLQVITPSPTVSYLSENKI